MALKGRLERLEAPVVRRWRESWDRFYDQVAALLPEVVLAHVETKLAPSEYEKAQRLIAALARRAGLDLPCWDAWTTATEPLLPDPAEPSLSHWPHDLPTPPPEPEGLLERLCLSAEGDDLEAWCSARVVLFLVYARVTREGEEIAH